MSATTEAPPLNPSVERLFAAAERDCMDITFGDVVLTPLMTDVLASGVSVATRLTTDIELHVPFLSAAMDTVTEHDMAIAMAKLGGIGVLHAALSPKDLRHEARSVKYHLNRLVEKPIAAQSGQTVLSLMTMCNKKGYDFRTFPVVDTEDRPIGIISNDDLKFWLGDGQQTVDEFMNKDCMVGDKDTTVEDAFATMSERRQAALPIINKRGKLKAMYVWADVKRISDDNPDNYSLDNDGRLLVAAAVESHPERAAERIEIAGKYIDVYVVDSSHGNAKEAAQTVEFLTRTYGPEIQVIGGNFTDGESALRLARAGAKAVKVGIGGGTICTTRVRTGNGTPQLTAIKNAVSALRESGYYAHIPVISDGGITSEGDANKAIAVGAASVMMGGRFAATQETPGQEFTSPDGKQYRIYRGMGSTAAQLAARDARGYSSGNAEQIFSEGVVSHVVAKGSVRHIVAAHVAGLRNAIANANAETVADFQQRVRVRRVTAAGTREASAHISEQGRIVSS